jgi:hypothetical protein
MTHINQFLNSNNKEDLWNNTTSEIKKEMIREMFRNKTKNHINLAREFLKFIRQDDKQDKRDIHAGYANLLCILLAKSHDPEFIKDIIETKQCGDLFFYVDSNLMFEFSPKRNRETCVRDTMDYVNNIKGSDPILNEEWFKTYKDWVNYYGNHYKEDLVIKFWNMYKEYDYPIRYCS